MTAIRSFASTRFTAATDAIVAWGSTDRLGRWVQVVRSLLALGTFLTLVVNPAAILLHFPTGVVPDEYCGGVLGLGAFCVSPFDTDTTRLLLAAMCVPLLIGFLPAVTGPLHWYAAFTVASNTLGVEGGDQLTVNLSALLCLASFVDGRLWGWRPQRSGADRPLSNIWVGVILFAARLQVAYVYFEAAIVKLSNPLWSDGTAMWLWVQNGGFGATPAVSAALQSLLAHPAVAVAATWGTIALELFLCLTIVFASAPRRRLRLFALACGILFHLAIAVVMGLVTFGVVMAAALLVALHRADDSLPRRATTESAPQREPETSILNGEPR
ncbi:MAG: hypothetical protein K0S37_3867 [Microbacterium sp.]|nr:hypothetical protein [Microbacterium sp.]